MLTIRWEPMSASGSSSGACWTPWAQRSCRGHEWSATLPLAPPVPHRAGAPGAHAGEGDDTTGVLGRYALQVHMCFNGSEGSRMVGLSAHELGGHAFVSHLSNGIDWVACTVHDNFADQF